MVSREGQATFWRPVLLVCARHLKDRNLIEISARHRRHRLTIVGDIVFDSSLRNSLRVAKNSDAFGFVIDPKEGTFRLGEESRCFFVCRFLFDIKKLS